ncbi:uncharacterized protein PGTG_18765 [Puccinia graminis f. sp. tritici CRL 75-36-700-3]|uniref:No apical meristem-associated C-terminal domain-containing protein n=1 Tax=Puccinia graminis f. sp. tritici (strain CRL 75-36-700-3 / race SCCL) TaxID=418459 RepID=E3L871_PUCGT|nr:uncharacterized protein PGTG_18765 [Puccinia graminis f. sp. tritici CRL 75-36-700-3]EFP92746.2 hypothetical protein PGTG_18765 [Puccinia graminis f. sp. tritici CRL 75-36-700-3]
MADTDPKSSTNTPTPTPSSPKKKKKKNNRKKKSTPPKETTTDTPKIKQPTDIATPQPADKSIIDIDPTPKAANDPAPKKGNPRWSIEEDKKLCVAWLNTSRDAIVGTGQKASTFWERIHATLSDLISEYNDEKKSAKYFKPLPLRPVGAVECRWALILKSVNKFSGCYSNAERRLKSGKTRDDILTEAKELYKASFGSAFSLDHCWGILKDSPKWQATQTENEARGKKADQSRTTSVASDGPASTPAASSPAIIDVDDDDSEISRSVLGNVRVEGQKAAKRKRADECSIEKIVGMQKELVQISRDRLSSMKAAMQSTLDNAIMSQDLSMMDDESRAYYLKKKRAIIAREEQEEKEKEEKEKKEKEEKEKKARQEKEEKERQEEAEKKRKQKEAEELEYESDDGEDSEGDEETEENE